MRLAYRLKDHMRQDPYSGRVYSSVHRAWQRIADQQQETVLASTNDVVRFGGEVVVV